MSEEPCREVPPRSSTTPVLDDRMSSDGYHDRVYAGDHDLRLSRLVCTRPGSRGLLASA
jgi:hypothetical protein